MSRKTLAKRGLIVVLTLAFGMLSMSADSCKTSNEKLQRDSKELEETSHKLEAERGCEPNPPYNCPKE